MTKQSTLFAEEERPRRAANKAVTSKKPRAARSGQSAPPGDNKPRPPKTAGTGVVPHRPPPPAAPRTTAELIWMALKDKTIPADKLEKMLAIKNAEEDRARRQEYDEAMRACQTAIPPITKTSWNTHTRSRWAKLEKISRVADPIIYRHGFSISYGMADCPKEDHYRITAVVTYRNGWREHYFADIGADAKGPKGEGNKSLAQGSGSSIAYGERYLKCMIFNIAVVGMDRDGNRQEDVPDDPAEMEPIGDEQLNELNVLMTATRTNSDKFCAHFKIKSVPALPKARFDQAMQMLRQREQVIAREGRLPHPAEDRPQ